MPNSSFDVKKLIFKTCEYKIIMLLVHENSNLLNGSLIYIGKSGPKNYSNFLVVKGLVCSHTKSGFGCADAGRLNIS